MVGPATAGSLAGTALRAALLLVAACAWSAPAQAQTGAARWISRWDLGECQLIRAVDDVERLAIKVTPGGDFAALWVRAAPGTEAPRGSRLSARLTLSPSAAILETDRVAHYRHEGNDIYVVTLPDQAVLAALAGGQVIRITVDGVELISLPLGNVVAGIDVLQQCMTDQLRTWGIDPVARAALQRRPEPLHEAGLAGFLTVDDYPADAVQRGVSGAAVVRLDVNPEGRVSACSVLQSSGDSALDRASCRAFQRRARFRPALDAQGAETTAPVVTRVTWTARTSM